MANLTNLNNKFLVQTGGNVGIGTTSPTAKLKVIGANDAWTCQIENTQALPYGLSVNTIGTAGTTFNSAFYTHSGTGMYIVNDGKVGIGTASPGATLDVNGATYVRNVIYGYAGAGNQYGGLSWGGTDEGFLFLKDSNVTKVNINSNGNSYLNGGNVGIGVTSPSRKFQIDQTSTTAGGAYVYSNAIHTGTSTNSLVSIRQDNASATGTVLDVRGDGTGNKLIVWDTTDVSLIVKDGGNVGIGTDSPSSKLSINAGVAAITAGPTVRISKGASPVGSIAYDTLVIEADDVPTIRFGENDGTVSTIMSGDSNLRINSTSPIKFFTAGTTTGPGHGGQGGTFAMIINNSQNVGIGTTSPSTLISNSSVRNAAASGLSTSLKGLNIEVPAGGNSQGYVASFANTQTASNNYNAGVLIEVGSTDTTTRLLSVESGGTNRFEIRGDGNVGIGTTSPRGKGLEIFRAAGNSSHPQLIISTGESSSKDYGISTDVAGAGDFAIVDGVTNVAANVRLLINSAGNVGIGTTSPAQPLSVHGNFLVRTTNADGNKNRMQCIVGGSSDAANLYLYHGNSGDGTVSVRINAQGSSYFNGGNVGIGNTNPTTKLTVQGVITAGDSTTNGGIKHQHQSFATMKPGPTSGGSIDMMFVDHTHALDITVMAYVSTSSVATGRGYSVTSYGSNTTGLTQTAFAGVVSALSISYVNSGGSESYVLRVTTTYSGATAPTISVTATGQSTSKLRAAT